MRYSGIVHGSESTTSFMWEWPMVTRESGLDWKHTPTASENGTCGVISLHSRSGRTSQRQRFQSLRACFGKSIAKINEPML